MQQEQLQALGGFHYSSSSSSGGGGGGNGKSLGHRFRSGALPTAACCLSMVLDLLVSRTKEGEGA